LPLATQSQTSSSIKDVSFGVSLIGYDIREVTSERLSSEVCWYIKYAKCKEHFREEIVSTENETDTCKTTKEDVECAGY
jgi:hypothetical protein